MNTGCLALRRVSAVVAAIAVMAGITLALEWTFRAIVLQTHPNGAALAANFSWMIRQCLYLLPMLILGGNLAARCAPHSPRAYLVTMICLQALLVVRAVVFAPEHPVPNWLWTQTLLVTPLPICLVGWLQIRQTANADAATHERAAAAGD